MVKPIFLSKTHFFKGIGGLYNNPLPQPPTKNPLTPKDRFLKRLSLAYTSSFIVFILKNALKLFFNFVTHA
ncbi:hypothetical protein HMPREF1417_01196 [Helicobacter pylori GAM260Bi]|uniref:Uncharacterized protein n=1 Tax=Helicobacter pylori GAM120Ai TaxID=1159029 RepID=A0AAV3IHL2_HELPX|nr:hypothetical protein HMPREF1401_00334 [Helicobacter pylori GAM120Ai]EMH18946.1 hypothetical protein HMPREF1417_01196 [Helicobacter pylori GAM260Bi]EMH23775.1 hypothetical protein HMPREF1419_01004 [Helicobacter pylori GAM263BFi]EMH70339.1 hypothetical protein HMPREF1452_01344 [Helicobacter pylori HP260Bi]RVZ08601.1 hypothetical protein EC516_00150 [Helicobacter pylori]